jgi:hypothetical protein
MISHGKEVPSGLWLVVPHQSLFSTTEMGGAA